ncbi:MAG TPA: helix-hairpin-helix domain-containing protein [Chiayiivirga sp.]|nr:helix-hairpin-helix domain-containing protein [Chiayiivirga sp.]
MNPTKVRREAVHSLTDLPNVGPATAADLRLLGITRPADLAQADPFALYQALCQQTATRHDPCVLDVFMSITDFAAGGPAHPWWDYTAERKRRYGALP